MPLPRNYYTGEEALGLMAQKFPSENAYQALLDLLHGWGLPTWIIDEKTGRRVDLPPETFFKPSFEDFRWPGGNVAMIRPASIRPASAEPKVDLDDLLSLRPSGDARRTSGPWVSGELRIDKGEFDRVLAATVGPEAPGLSREAQKKGGSRPKYDQGLQSFINQRSTEFAKSGKPFSLATLKDWLLENAPHGKSYDSGLPNCDELEFEENTLFWIDRRGHPVSRRATSLEPYIQRAKQR